MALQREDQRSCRRPGRLPVNTEDVHGNQPVRAQSGAGSRLVSVHEGLALPIKIVAPRQQMRLLIEDVRHVTALISGWLATVDLGLQQRYARMGYTSGPQAQILAMGTDALSNRSREAATSTPPDHVPAPVRQSAVAEAMASWRRHAYYAGEALRESTSAMSANLRPAMRTLQHTAIGGLHHLQAHIARVEGRTSGGEEDHLGEAARRRRALGENLPPEFTESFRLLASTVQHLTQKQALKTILVMGAYRGDGRTTTVAHLGIALAGLGKRVVVVEGDVRRPGLGRLLLGTEGEQQAAARSGSVGLVHDTDIPRLGVVLQAALGGVAAGPAGLEQVLASLRPTTDYIILDSPPCLTYADAFFLAPLADGIIYVVRRRSQDISAQRNVQARLMRLGANVLGMVFNER